MSLNNNILPATLNLDNPIATSNINLIPKIPLEKISYSLSNSLDLEGQTLRYYLKVFNIFIFIFLILFFRILFLFLTKE